MENCPASLIIPDWLTKEIAILPTHLKSSEERMAAIINFSRLNFEYNTGGPFAAGIFERDSGKLVTVCVNPVTALNCSSAHAEILAISTAQRILQTYDLGGENQPAHQLVVNWRPCAMCYGAVIWSGVRSLLIAGSGPELEELTGFDEGPLTINWRAELSRRGIELVDNIMRQEACAVFNDFSKASSAVYNPRR